MSENTQNLDPEAFDIDEWLVDAALPEESVDVYKRPDVIGELSEIKRRIEELQDAGDTGEQTAGEKSERRKLETKYEMLLNTFGNSRLTIYVSAIPKEIKADLRAAHEARVAAGEVTQPLDRQEFGWALLSEAIVGVKTGDGDRRGARWTVNQVKSLAKKIGDVQMTQMIEAHQTAQNAIPQVDADFLHSASGTSKEPDEA